MATAYKLPAQAPEAGMEAQIEAAIARISGETRLSSGETRSNREIMQEFYNAIKGFGNEQMLGRFYNFITNPRIGSGMRDTMLEAFAKFSDPQKLTEGRADSIIGFLEHMDNVYVQISRCGMVAMKSENTKFFRDNTMEYNICARRAGLDFIGKLGWEDLDSGGRLLSFASMAEEMAKLKGVESFHRIFMGRNFSMEYFEPDHTDMRNFAGFLEVFRTGKYTLELCKLGVDMELYRDPEKLALFLEGVKGLEKRLAENAGLYGSPILLIREFLYEIPKSASYVEKLAFASGETERYIKRYPAALFKKEQEEMKAIADAGTGRYLSTSEIAPENLGNVEVVWQGEAAIFDATSSREIIYTSNASSCASVAIIARGTGGEPSKVCLAHIDPVMKEEDVAILFDKMKVGGDLEVYIIGGENQSRQKVYRYAKSAGAKIHILEEEKDRTDAAAVDKRGNVYLGVIERYNDDEKTDRIDYELRSPEDPAADRSIHIRHVK